MLSAVLALFVGSTSLGALDPHRAITQYHATAYGEQSGLATSGITALAVDGDGFLWVGSGRSLMRFDGRGTLPAAFPQTPPGLITEILSTRDGRLWAGTLEGLFVSQPHQRALVPVDLPLTRPPVIHSLLEDPAGRVWVGTDEGLFVYRENRFELVTGQSRRPYGAVYALAITRRQGTLWVGTEWGLYSLDIRHLQGSRTRGPANLTPAAPSILPALAVRSLALSHQGESLWAGFADGQLLRVGTEQDLEVSMRLDVGVAVTALLEDRDGQLWAGAESRGLMRWAGSESSWLDESLGLEGDHITHLVEDRAGNLWVGAENGALHRLSNGEVTILGTREGLSSNFLRSVALTADGALWIGTENSGLDYRMGDQVIQLTTADGLASNAVLALAAVGEDLWIGTTGGLQVLRQGRPSASALRTIPPSPGSPPPVVLALEPAKAGGLWVGTTSGLLRYTPEQGLRAALDAPDWNGIPIRSLLESPSGELWVGTEVGLLQLTPTDPQQLDSAESLQLKLLTRSEGLAGDYVLDLYMDPAGVLWVGSIGGLTRVAPSGIYSFGVEDGLHNDVLHTVTEDQLGIFWLCSNRGLFRVPRNQLEAKAAGAPDRVSSRVVQGTRDRSCDGNNHPTHLWRPDGSLLQTTAGGLISLYPQREESHRAPPEVIIESVLADGLPQEVTPTLALPVGTRDVEVQFAAPTLSYPRGTQFLYRLGQRDKDWIETSEPYATYTNFPQGSFRLEVLARDGSGLTSSQPANLKLLLAPPTLLRSKNLGLISLFILVLGRGLYQIRFRQLLEQNRKLEDRVTRRTAQIMEQRDDLEAANGRLKDANDQLQRANRELSLRNRENTELLSMAAHDLRRPLLNLRVFAGEIRTTLDRLAQHHPQLAEAMDEAAAGAYRQAFEKDAPEALSYVDTSTERMDQLISALLALSQVGRQRLEHQEVDLDELVDETLRSLTYQISRDNVQIRKAPLPKIWADPQALKQVLENLLNNAVTYLSPERDGEVSIEAEESIDEIIVHVRDNGRGIADGERHKVFKIFGRAGSPDVPGEGLGLAFVRTLIERHGGRIWFTSQLGAGTTFSFCLPQRPESPPDLISSSANREDMALP
ncbi:MAG: two-component regulator propeller domain-containing protein [Acidobacteriota bacterium]